MSINNQNYTLTEQIREEEGVTRILVDKQLPVGNRTYNLQFGTGYPVENDASASAPKYYQYRDQILGILNTLEITDSHSYNDWHTYVNLSFNYSFSYLPQLELRATDGSVVTAESGGILVFPDQRSVDQRIDLLLEFSVVSQMNLTFSQPEETQTVMINGLEAVLQQKDTSQVYYLGIPNTSSTLMIEAFSYPPDSDLSQQILDTFEWHDGL